MTRKEGKKGQNKNFSILAVAVCKRKVQRKVKDFFSIKCITPSTLGVIIIAIAIVIVVVIIIVVMICRGIRIIYTDQIMIYCFNKTPFN